MCIRNAFIIPLAETLAREFEPNDQLGLIEQDELERLLEAIPEAIFAHPMALARQLIATNLVDADVGVGPIVEVIGQLVRAYRRHRERHGDLFTGTPAAIPPIGGKTKLPESIRRLAAEQDRERRTRELALRRRHARAQSELERARRGQDRPLGRNVVDLVALRARAAQR